MHGYWIIKQLFIIIGGWAIVRICYSMTKDYLKRRYSHYDVPNDQQPKPVLPTAARRATIAVRLALAAIFISVLIARGLSESRFADTFAVLLCLVLPTIWWTVESYFGSIELKRAREAFSEELGMLETSNRTTT